MKTKAIQKSVYKTLAFVYLIGLSSEFPHFSNSKNRHNNETMVRLLLDAKRPSAPEGCDSDPIKIAVRKSNTIVHL